MTPPNRDRHGATLPVTVARKRHSLPLYDLILALDSENRADLLRLAAAPADRAKVRLLRDYDPQADGDRDVPDPWYGGPDGFEQVFAMIERSCRGLLAELIGQSPRDSEPEMADPERE